MKRRGLVLISILALASLMSLTAFGQVRSSISGAVHDPNGEVVSGATVTVKNTATGAEFGTFSSATFAQVNDAYRDSSNTNDPGGRLVQIVARINF